MVKEEVCMFTSGLGVNPFKFLCEILSTCELVLDVLKN